MGRMMGAFDDSDDLERADLNKCPDCGCFFPQDNCPICGKECPEEMRAGNRAPVKKSKKKRGGSSRTVTFIDWYHRWWFIIVMLIFFPFVGIILLATSPHKKSHKIAFIAVGVAIMIVSYFGVQNIVNTVMNHFDKPVDTSLPRADYIAACEKVEPEEYYRDAESYEGDFVSLTLTVVSPLTDVYAEYEGEKYTSYYVCNGADGDAYEILVRDCIQDSRRNYLPGDVITVYGEGDGNETVYDANGNPHTAPVVNAAYVGE